MTLTAKQLASYLAAGRAAALRPFGPIRRADLAAASAALAAEALCRDRTISPCGTGGRYIYGTAWGDLGIEPREADAARRWLERNGWRYELGADCWVAE